MGLNRPLRAMRVVEDQTEGQTVEETQNQRTKESKNIARIFTSNHIWRARIAPPLTRHLDEAS